LEATAYTCDYSWGNKGNCYDSRHSPCWHKLAADPDALQNVVELPQGKQLYGEHAVHVRNSAGPRVLIEFKHAPEKETYVFRDLRFSAWVFPLGDTKYIRFAVRLLHNAGELEKELDYVARNLIPGKWQLIEYHVDREHFKTNTNAHTVEAWVGNAKQDPEGTPYPEFYVQDLRLGPADALTRTTYYDPTHGLPTLTVDANNQPGRKVTYDEFGRPVTWEEPIFNEDGTFREWMVVEERKYHLYHDGVFLSPPDKKRYCATDQIVIEWHSAKVDYVDLSYSIDGGVTWIEIAENQSTPDDGKASYEWTLGSALGTTRIKVENSSDPSNKTVSEAFQILPGLIDIMYPHEGMTFRNPHTVRIRWINRCHVNNVNIKYSGNGGKSWSSIADNQTNSGSYLWTVPDDLDTQVGYLIRIEDVANENVYDELPGPFHFTSSRRSLILKKLMGFF